MNLWLQSHRARGWLCVGGLAGAVLWVWLQCAAIEPRWVLTFAALNIGQGDAVYIESPSGVRVLLDGGPDASVLGELSKVMPLSVQRSSTRLSLPTSSKTEPRTPRSASALWGGARKAGAAEEDVA